MTDLSINKLYTYQRGFRKEFGKQHCLFVMIKKSWKMQDSNGLFAAVFTDISHELLIAKLHAYRFDTK